MSPHDPRVVCNLMLDEADHQGLLISNLVLQKLLYFVHSLYLIENRLPLVSGYFEAWQYGPVHPVAYKAFKAAGGKPISFRACRQDPLSGRLESLARMNDATVSHVVRRVLNSFGGLTPGRLVEMSHARGAPWHFVVDDAKNSMALGLRITDKIILDRFKFHKVSVGPEPLGGEPFEDAPFA